MTPSAEGSHYEVLGLDPRASGERIERAYRFHVELYDDAALATYSLLDADETRAARTRIREAYEVLSDPARRRAYDVSLGVVQADDVAEHPEPSRPAPPAPVAAAADASADPHRPPQPPVARERLAGPVTGQALREFREERGVGLHEIAAVSKVGVPVLLDVLEEAHSDLPAPVYLRGFLQEYARCLGLEPQATADAYLARVPRQP